MSTPQEVEFESIDEIASSYHRRDEIEDSLDLGNCIEVFNRDTGDLIKTIDPFDDYRLKEIILETYVNGTCRYTLFVLGNNQDDIINALSTTREDLRQDEDTKEYWIVGGIKGGVRVVRYGDPEEMIRDAKILNPQGIIYSLNQDELKAQEGLQLIDMIKDQLPYVKDEFFYSPNLLEDGKQKLLRSITGLRQELVRKINKHYGVHTTIKVERPNHD